MVMKYQNGKYDPAQNGELCTLRFSYRHDTVCSIIARTLDTFTTRPKVVDMSCIDLGDLDNSSIIIKRIK